MMLFTKPINLHFVHILKESTLKFHKYATVKDLINFDWLVSFAYTLRERNSFIDFLVKLGASLAVDFMADTATLLFCQAYQTFSSLTLWKFDLVDCSLFLFRFLCYCFVFMAFLALLTKQTKKTKIR